MANLRTERLAEEICNLESRKDGALAEVGRVLNTFEPEPPSDAAYAGISEMRADVNPQRYLQFVHQWLAAGASIVGGCCGIGPEHIAEIADYLKSAAAQPKRAAIPQHKEFQHDVCVACRA